MKAVISLLWYKFGLDVLDHSGGLPPSGMKTLDTTSSGSTVTRNGLGARGIDRIERVNSSGTTVGYPLYDGHGNMVATLGKSGSSYFAGRPASL